MNEIWKPIKDYEGLYEVSNLGRVKSLNYKRTGKEKILKNSERNGYLVVSLVKNGKLKQFYVHKLVAEAFILNPENKPCIDHINTIRNDNRIENLRWVTYKENMNNELTKEKLSGENNYNYGKPRSEEIKKKISESQKGGKNPKARGVFCYELNKSWNTSAEASRELNIDSSNITKCCKGKCKSVKGYHFCYLEELKD